MKPIIINNRIRLPDNIPAIQLEQIKKAFTITNPEFRQIMEYKHIKEKNWGDYSKGGYYLSRSKVKGRWTTKAIPVELYYWDFDNRVRVILPRGAAWDLKKILKRPIQSEKHPVKKASFIFKGELLEKKGQPAIKELSHKNGIVQAPTGSGKTVMALWLIAKLSVRTCIVVDTTELMNQWAARIKQFLGVSKIGRIGAGEMNIQPISVALMQTLREQEAAINAFDCLIIDECHIAATESYEKIINAFTGEYVYGLSATPVRKDGKTAVMKWLLGPIRIVVDYKDAERCPAKVKVIPTQFKTEINFRSNYQAGIRARILSQPVNELITQNIEKEIDRFGIQLVTSRSVQHLYLIKNTLLPLIQMVSRVLVGQVSKEDRKTIVKEAAEGKLKILFATEQLLGKGFDEPLLSVLHMATPIKDVDFLTQVIGRVTRVHEGKTEALILDYWDNMEPVLGRSVKARLKKYVELEIKRTKI